MAVLKDLPIRTRVPSIIPVLVPVWNDHEKNAHHLNTGTLLCGSDASCDVHIPLTGVNERHCSLEFSQGELFAERIGGHLWVNDIPVNTRCQLVPDDILSIGPASFRIEFRPASRAEASIDATSNADSENGRARTAISQHLEYLERQLSHFSRSDDQSSDTLDDALKLLLSEQTTVIGQGNNCDRMNLVAERDLNDDHQVVLLQLRTLAARTEQLETELEAARSERKMERQSHCDELQQQQLDYDSQLQQLHIELSTIKQQNAQLAQERADLLNELEQAREQQPALMLKTQELETELAALQSQHAIQQQNLFDNRQQLQLDYDSQLQQLHIELSTIKQQNAQLAQERIDLLNELEQAREQQPALLLRTQELESELAALQSQHAIQQQDLFDNLQQQRLDYDSQQQQQQLHNELANIKQQNAQLAQERADLLNELEQAREQQPALLLRTQELENELLVLRDTYAQQQDLLDNLLHQQFADVDADADTDLLNCNSEAEVLREINQLRDDLRHSGTNAEHREVLVSKELEQLSRDILDRDQLLVQLRDELREMSKRLSQSQGELEQQRSQLQQTNSKLEEKQTAFDICQQELRNVREELAESRSRNNTSKPAAMIDVGSSEFSESLDLRSELADLFRLAGATPDNAMEVETTSPFGAGSPDERREPSSSDANADQNSDLAGTERQPSNALEATDESESDFVQSYMEKLLSRSRRPMGNAGQSADTPTELQPTAQLPIIPANLPSTEQHSSFLEPSEARPSVDREKLRENLNRLRSVTAHSVASALASAAVRKDIGGIKARIFLVVTMILLSTLLILIQESNAIRQPILMWSLVAGTTVAAVELIYRLSSIRSRLRSLHGVSAFMLAADVPVQTALSDDSASASDGSSFR